MGRDRASRYEAEGARAEVGASPQWKADRVVELTATRAAATAVSAPSRIGFPRLSVRISAPLPERRMVAWTFPLRTARRTVLKAALT